MLTKELLREITNSKEFTDLADCVLIAMARAQLTREKVDSYAIPLFVSMGIVEGKAGRREAGTPILDPKYAYTADPECPLFDRYLKLLHPLHIDNGFDVEPDCCPALIAEHNLTKAENNLLQFMEEKASMPHWNLLEERVKMINLYLGLRASQVN